MIYHRLQDLVGGNLKHGHEIYASWLQWVSMEKKGNGPSQEILQEDGYWMMLQVCGLVTSVIRLLGH